MNENDNILSREQDSEASRNETFLMELAGLISNLHSLEFMLRVKLFNVGSKPHNPESVAIDFGTLNVGNVVHENALTDFDSLGRLIDRYNREIANSNPHRLIDKSVVTLRDTVAHGRVAFSGNSAVGADRFLVKFSKPEAGECTVVYSQPMSNEWLAEQRLFVSAQFEKLMS